MDHTGMFDSAHPSLFARQCFAEASARHWFQPEIGGRAAIAMRTVPPASGLAQKAIDRRGIGGDLNAVLHRKAGIAAGGNSRMGRCGHRRASLPQSHDLAHKFPPEWRASLAQAALPSNMAAIARSEEHTSELQSLMRKSYAVFC